MIAPNSLPHSHRRENIYLEKSGDRQLDHMRAALRIQLSGDWRNLLTLSKGEGGFRAVETIRNPPELDGHLAAPHPPPH